MVRSGVGQELLSHRALEVFLLHDEHQFAGLPDGILLEYRAFGGRGLTAREG